MKNLRMILKSKKGFTLIELIVVIAILAILAAIAIPRLASFTDQANIRADKASAATIGKAVEMYYASHGAPSAAVTYTFDGLAAAAVGTAEGDIEDMVKDGTGNIPDPVYKTATNTVFVAVAGTNGSCIVYYNAASGTGSVQLYPEP